VFTKERERKGNQTIRWLAPYNKENKKDNQEGVWFDFRGNRGEQPQNKLQKEKLVMRPHEEGKRSPVVAFFMEVEEDISLKVEREKRKKKRSAE